MDLDALLKQKLEELGLPNAGAGGPIQKMQLSQLMLTVIAAGKKGDLLEVLKSLRDGIDQIIQDAEKRKENLTAEQVES